MNKTNLTIDEVKKIAKLAQLNLTDEKVTKFQEQLSEVINYVEILKEIKTDDVQPTSQVAGLENITRKDQVKTSLTVDEALSGAPNIEKQMFVTQAVFKKHDES